MALTHHCIVRMAGVMVGISKFRNYLILGDDIVIANKLVAESYISIMEGLGVAISKPKCVIRNDTH